MTAARRRAGATSAAVVAATLLVALWLTYTYSAVLGPFLLAAAFAYILEPVVQRLQHRGMSRAVAVVTVFAVAGIAGVVLATLLAWQGIELIAALAADGGPLAEGMQRLRELVGEQLRASPWRDRLEEIATPERLAELVAPAATVITTVIGALTSTLNLLTIGVLLPIYLFYLMLDLPAIWQWLRQHLPAHDRQRTLRVLDELHEGFAAFLRGRLLLAVLKGLLTAIGLLLCGTPYWLLVGLVAGILSIVPFVGAALGFVVALALTAAQVTGWWPLLGVALVFAAAEFVEGMILQPWVMKQGVSLHPLTVLLCVMFWGAVLGLFGALVAIPLTLLLKVLLRAYVLPHVERLAA